MINIDLNEITIRPEKLPGYSTKTHYQKEKHMNYRFNDKSIAILDYMIGLGCEEGFEKVYQRDLAYDIGLAPTSCSKHITRLIHAGYICKRTGGYREINEYMVIKRLEGMEKQ